MSRTLPLPAVDATGLSGWLATLGATRILAARWPGLALHFDERTPLLTGGPASIEEAVAAIRADTLDAIPSGGVLPGVDPRWPPAGSGWWRRPEKPPLRPEPWVGPDETWEDWQAALISPTGLLHPLIVPHAAQTVRRMIDKAGQILAARPELLAQALTGPGTGLTSDYPGGLWIDLWRPDPGSLPNQASPGRDWLAIMSLPWMPAQDDPDHTPGQPQWRRSAPGWRWRITGAGPGTRQLVYGWWLWSSPLPATAIPAVLTAPSPAYLPGPTVRCGAFRPPRRPSDPPMLRDLTMAEVAAGALDDVRLYSYAEVAQIRGVKESTLRGYVQRGQCPGPDAQDDLGAPCWRAETIEPWLARPRRPGTRTDLTGR